MYILFIKIRQKTNCKYILCDIHINLPCVTDNNHIKSFLQNKEFESINKQVRIIFEFLE